MNYAEKLKHPMWQKKRLEILSRDEFTCQRCGSKDKMLHVHHRYYLKVEFPWEYPDKALVTLCFECHEEEEQMVGSKQLFLQGWCQAGFFNSDLEGVSGYISSTKLSRYQMNELFIFMGDEEFCNDLSDLLKVHRQKPIPNDLEF